MLNNWQNKVKDYFILTRQDKPVGTILFFWSTAWALSIAGQEQHNLKIILIFLIGTWLMRSAGCTMNDFADRDFDKFIERTKNRPITAKRVSSKEALILAAILSLIAFALVIQLGWKVASLSAMGLLLAIIYPYMKRYTWWPQLFLGLAFSWGIPMVFMTYQQTIPPFAWLLYSLSILWIIAYDTIYALMDQEDDIKINIKSTALYWGEQSKKFIALLQILFLLGWLLIAFSLKFHSLFWLGWLATLLSFIYQHYLIQKNSSENYLKAFKNNQYTGFFTFIATLGIN